MQSGPTAIVPPLLSDFPEILTPEGRYVRNVFTGPVQLLRSARPELVGMVSHGREVLIHTRGFHVHCPHRMRMAPGATCCSMEVYILLRRNPVQII